MRSVKNFWDILRSMSVECNGFILKSSTSLGVAIYPECGDSGEALTRCADLAMYAAKVKGGNNFCIYTPDIEQSHP